MFYNAELTVRRYHAYSLFALIAGCVLGLAGLASIANGFLTSLPASPVTSPLIDVGATLLVVAMVAFYAFWFLRGVAYYGSRRQRWALALPLAPVVTVVHSMGTVLGILHSPDGFRVTRKVGIGA